MHERVIMIYIVRNAEILFKSAAFCSSLFVRYTGVDLEELISFTLPLCERLGVCYAGSRVTQ